MAEFLATYGVHPSKSRKASHLRKHLVSKCVTDDVSLYFLRSTSPEGWLYRFGAYRDLFTHTVAMEQTSAMGFTIQDTLTLQNGQTVPQLYYPLPSDLSAIEDGRRKGSPFRTFSELQKQITTHRDRAVELDALEYLHRSFDLFADFSEKLISLSPLAPDPIIITEQDIVPGTFKTVID